MGTSPLFYSFWGINGPLDQKRLCHQLDLFREAGLDGVVFHPRYYPNQPPYLCDLYFEMVSAAILYAKSIGLRFWIYDENGWPSGTVGGALREKYPDVSQRWAELVPQRPETCLAEFEHQGQRWFLGERTGGGVDYLNPALSQYFIAMTHERYRACLTPEAFEYVEAIFSDEPEWGLGHIFGSLPAQGSIPWTPRLPELFQERYGEPLQPLLPLLFFEGERSHEARIRFRELLTDLFCDAFISPVNQWCEAHGKLFTAHVKGEEHPLFQAHMVGSCHQVFRRLSMPGIDALERDPSGAFFPRQLSSAARQFGRGRCMAEAFGGAGWGAGPSDLEQFLLWLGNHGVTDFVLHLSQYRLDSAAMLDWPPSQPLHLSWSKLYSEVIAKVRSQLQAAPRPAAKALVVAPYRAIMGTLEPWELLQTNVHNAQTHPDSRAGKINDRFIRFIEALEQQRVAYDVADERTLEEAGERAPGGIKVGHCVYGEVLVTEDCELRPSAHELIAPFKSPAVVPVAPTQAGLPVPQKEGSMVEVKWTLEEFPVNALFLECTKGADGWHSASFACAPALAESLEVIFLDNIFSAELNGTPLTLEPVDDGCRAKLPPVQPANVLRFRTEMEISAPYAWVEGRFRATSATPFQEGPGGTVRTEGPFLLEPVAGISGRDLVATGYPFLCKSVLIAGTADLPCAVTSIRFDGLVADAVRVSVDGRDLGWTWPQEGEYRIAAPLTAGTHRLRLELIPNTFNYRGPHHYYRGDAHLVSPDQITGVRNFADPADAPKHTHVNAWHFRRFELPASLTVFGA